MNINHFESDGVTQSAHESRLIYQDVPPRAPVIAEADSVQAMVEQPPNVFTRMTRWFGRRLRAASGFLKYPAEEVPKTIDAAKTSIGSIIIWARDNIKEALDVGKAFGKTGWNATKEAARVPGDPIKGIINRTRTYFTNVFYDKRYNGWNKLWRVPLNSSFALFSPVIAPVTGTVMGTRNLIMGNPANDNDPNILTRAKNTVWDKDGGGVKGIAVETGELLKQTWYTGPRTAVEGQASAIGQITDITRRLAGRAIDAVPVPGTESIANALLVSNDDVTALRQLMRGAPVSSLTTGNPRPPAQPQPQQEREAA